MRRMRPLPLLALTSVLIFFCALLCRTAAVAQSAAPAVQIAAQIDESNLVTLKGNTHPAANARNDRGRGSPDLPMTDLILVLSRDPARQAAFDKFVAGQYDPDSPNFHQWLTPEQVGAGLWPLANRHRRHFKLAYRPRLFHRRSPQNRMSIRFSGSAAQVESTFHTEIHNLEVKGVAAYRQHERPAHSRSAYAGRRWRQVAAQLFSAAAAPDGQQGFEGLRHRKVAARRQSSTAPAVDSAAGSATPRPAMRARSSASMCPPAAPVPPTWLKMLRPTTLPPSTTFFRCGTRAPIDGTGQTIAIAGTSDIDLGRRRPPFRSTPSAFPHLTRPTSPRSSPATASRSPFARIVQLYCTLTT